MPSFMNTAAAVLSKKNLMWAGGISFALLVLWVVVNKFIFTLPTGILPGWALWFVVTLFIIFTPLLFRMGGDWKKGLLIVGGLVLSYILISMGVASYKKAETPMVSKLEEECEELLSSMTTWEAGSVAYEEALREGQGAGCLKKIKAKWITEFDVSARVTGAAIEELERQFQMGGGLTQPPITPAGSAAATTTVTTGMFAVLQPGQQLRIDVPTTGWTLPIPMPDPSHGRLYWQRIDRTKSYKIRFNEDDKLVTPLVAKYGDVEMAITTIQFGEAPEPFTMLVGCCRQW